MADLVTFYFRDRLDQWQQENERKINSQTGVYLDQDSYTGFWENPEVAQRDIASWLKLANEVEKLLLD